MGGREEAAEDSLKCFPIKIDSYLLLQNLGGCFAPKIYVNVSLFILSINKIKKRGKKINREKIRIEKKNK